jgi:hypothetical protein
VLGPEGRCTPKARRLFTREALAPRMRPKRPPRTRTRAVGHPSTEPRRMFRCWPPFYARGPEPCSMRTDASASVQLVRYVQFSDASDTSDDLTVATMLPRLSRSEPIRTSLLILL